MALDLSMLQHLQTPTPPPNPLESMARVVGLRNAMIQGQDLQAQIAERQAIAQQRTLANQKQQRLSEILATAKVNPDTGAPDPQSPEMQQLFREFPEVHAALNEHYSKTATEASNRETAKTTRQNLQSEIEDRIAKQNQAKATEADRVKKEADALAKNEAMESAGVLIPNSETFLGGEKFGLFKVRQPNGTYANERRSLGKTEPEPKAPEAPMSPERFKQEQTLKGSEDQAVQLTPAGLDITATNFAKTGQLPPMGMGKQGAAVRSKIINRAAEINPTLDIASNKADFDANKASLTGLQKNRDAVVSFENTANKNLDLLLSKADKIIDTGSPWINQPLRAVAAGGLGSEDIPTFNAARQVAINEIAKVTSNPGLTGQLSDNARREVEAFIPASATFKQIVSVAKLLKQDMKNRHDSLDEQIGAIQNRIKGSGGNTAATATGPKIGDTVRVGGKQVTITAIHPNGTFDAK